MTKAEMKRMNVTARDRFTLDGCEYRPESAGTSARGIWTYYTDGTHHLCVYKRDLLAVDEDKAFLLFHGYKA